MKNFFTFNGTMLTIIQFLALASSIVGVFVVPWSWFWASLTILFFYVYGMLGMSLTLHRYFSHKAFEFRNPVVKWIFISISVISARGSPLAWVHIHREHHAYSDTDRDPHKPGSFKMFSFKTTNISTVKKFLIKDLMVKEQKIIHEYYLLFIIAWCLALLLINPVSLYFAWLLPVCLNQVSQDLWNYFSHVNVGYRNFDTNDNSRNVFWLWPLIMGEAWHNNHHGNSKDYRLSSKYWEIDPVGSLIGVLKK